MNRASGTTDDGITCAKLDADGAIVKVVVLKEAEVNIGTVVASIVEGTVGTSVVRGTETHVGCIR